MRTGLIILLFACWPVCGQEPPAGAPGPAAPAAAGYRLEPGPFEPAQADLKLGELPVRVRYPGGAAVAGPLPLIVFSHGMGGSSDAFAEVTSQWVSHGYVVILPTHADSVKRQGRDGRTELLRDAEAYRRRVDPEGRVADVRLILDSLDQVEMTLDVADVVESHGAGSKRTPRRGLIDRERIGIAGHSAGALTTQMAIGAKVRTRQNPRLHSVADDRFDAAIVISGQGTSNRMFTENSWKGIARPMLVITGSKDAGPVGNETPETRQHPYRFAAAGDKFLLFIEGATHSSYQGPGRGARVGRVLDREDAGTDLKVIGDAVMSQTLAFWDAYLKRDDRASAYLREDRVVALDPAVKAEHK